MKKIEDLILGNWFRIDPKGDIWIKTNDWSSNYMGRRFRKIVNLKTGELRIIQNDTLVFEIKCLHDY